ncbi:MAG: dual specificity protein phosphatase family protein [Thermococcus sp.]|uniref:protein-tyrosine phosphatase family protein n=1 Tax=Thermococcus sp. TaxID=35749 RepID=UPI00183F9107|nr:dual specificity protein phosphatase family protein [Thermococcus sp.]MCD6140662.1 dual specificity protein phosphatase family protein [Thermococcus sp.]MCD6143659.1 dual specificity protein phosphatase family protein [Thermococcus sp.]HDG64321.1 protein tyrosine phosphatase [Thermococcus sp.]
MIYPKFVNDKVAFSSMPYPEDIPKITEEFDAVIILTYEYEMYYDMEELLKREIEVLYAPIEDFTAPTLEELLEIVKWIQERARQGKKVLIHCLGGSGRSGTVAVAYLMYSEGLSLRDALTKVRSLKPSAVETEEQTGVLKELGKYLKQRKA